MGPPPIRALARSLRPEIGVAWLLVVAWYGVAGCRLKGRFVMESDTGRDFDVDPAIHLVSSGEYRVAGSGSVGPFPALISDRAEEYRQRFPSDRSDVYGPVSDGELGICAEMLAELAVRLQHDITEGRVSGDATAYAELTQQYSERLFKARSGPDDTF